MMTALKSTSALEGTGIEARCAATGMRMTEQRRVIARVLAEAVDHPDVELRPVGRYAQRLHRPLASVSGRRGAAPAVQQCLGHDSLRSLARRATRSRRPAGAVPAGTDVGPRS